MDAYLGSKQEEVIWICRWQTVVTWPIGTLANGIRASR